MDTENQKEIAEEQMIRISNSGIANDYLATKHRKRIEIITKAFNFANQAHKGIKRRSGEPYIHHPIAVPKTYAMINRPWLAIPFVRLCTMLSRTPIIQ